ncbi:Os05g0471116 [Oryza sativa Japonica Group]|uniref:Os05g0471116 protein n=1 Tax=Oryza sativa subsp. japonica TaxID=39947 RepID=A0A0P0WNJ8_ORYSJ|nr:hypothetical protein EE612_030107 [Oryza sativa]BAS94490.1 Os05g0471116 [Oryza sativa Japonica Group]
MDTVAAAIILRNELAFYDVMISSSAHHNGLFFGIASSSEIPVISCIHAVTSATVGLSMGSSLKHNFTSFVSSLTCSSGTDLSVGSTMSIRGLSPMRYLCAQRIRRP